MMNKNVTTFQMMINLLFWDTMAYQLYTSGNAHTNFCFSSHCF